MQPTATRYGDSRQVIQNSKAGVNTRQKLQKNTKSKLCVYVSGHSILFYFIAFVPENKALQNQSPHCPSANIFLRTHNVLQDIRIKFSIYLGLISLCLLTKIMLFFL